MKLLLLKSFFRKVSEHNSTATSKTTALGFALAKILALPKPATPPAQPSPKIGVRLALWFSFIWLMIKASKLGVASPVVEINMMSVISSFLLLERARHFSMASMEYCNERLM